MADTKFTPGPWLSGHLGSDSKCQCQSILAEGYMGCIATVEVDNGRAVSDGGNDAPPLEEAVANMHLISAAPDLYEALAGARDYVAGDLQERKEIYRGYEKLGHIDQVERELKAIDAALAKARGEAV